MKEINNSPFYIGNVPIPGRVTLGPMAGVTDMPYRRICHDLGAALTCTEMISAKGLLYNNQNTAALMETDQGEHPVAIQLFGNDPQIMAEMAKKIEDRPFEILDINMGCPVPKVVKNGEGSALMQDPVLVGKIVEAISNAIKKPVTVKIRKGFGENDANAPEVAYAAQESGAAAVAVHGRTRMQFYHGKADWDIIRQVKERLRIPVIGNGDVCSGETALEMMQETGCDAVMIGRAAEGAPWIFREVSSYLASRKITERPSSEEIIKMLLHHTEKMIEFKGEETGIREMRKQFAWYTTGMKESSAFRNRINFAETYNEFREMALELLEKQ